MEKNVPCDNLQLLTMTGTFPDVWGHNIFKSSLQMLIYFRNSATQTVEQELLFVGQEAGKLLAVRDIVQKVKRMIICCDMIKVFAVVLWFFFQLTTVLEKNTLNDSL